MYLICCSATVYFPLFRVARILWGSTGTVSERMGYLDFTFMGQFIVNVYKYNQQDATLHNSLYYYKCSTCFRRFLRQSSGAQNSIHSIGYLSSFFCFLPLWRVSWDCSPNSLTIAVRSRKSSTDTRCCVYSRAPDDGRRNRLKQVEQRFSNFFQVGTTFISQNVLRTTLLLGLSNSLGLP